MARNGAIAMTLAMISQRSIGQLVAEYPSRGSVFEKFAIDYCCHGQFSLAEACAAYHADLTSVVEAIHDNDCLRLTPRADEWDWRRVPLAMLIDEIQTRHHGLLRAELPRLGLLLDTVAVVHRIAHPEFRILQRLYRQFVGEIVPHMLVEEHVVFPAIKRWESGQSNAPSIDELLSEIMQMQGEHDATGRNLGNMRELTNGYQPPLDACRSVRALLSGLAAIEADMHLHLHKENNILFSRVLRSLQGMGRSVAYA